MSGPRNGVMVDRGPRWVALRAQKIGGCRRVFPVCDARLRGAPGHLYRKSDVRALRRAGAREPAGSDGSRTVLPGSFRPASPVLVGTRRGPAGGPSARPSRRSRLDRHPRRCAAVLRRRSPPPATDRPFGSGEAILGGSNTQAGCLAARSASRWRVCCRASSEPAIMGTSPPVLRDVGRGSISDPDEDPEPVAMGVGPSSRMIPLSLFPKRRSDAGHLGDGSKK